MAKIIRMWPETEDKKIIYKMTTAASTSVKDLNEEDVVKPTRYCLYEDVNGKGEENEILSILDENGLLISTISKTFKRDFFVVADLMEDEPFEIVIKKGTSKNGREFVTCEMLV